MRRRATASALSQCADCKRVVVSLCGASLTILFCSTAIAFLSIIVGDTPTSRCGLLLSDVAVCQTQSCRKTHSSISCFHFRTWFALLFAVLLVLPAILTFHLARKFCITSKLKWNAQRSFRSDALIMLILMVISYVAGAFSSTYGAHL